MNHRRAAQTHDEAAAIRELTADRLAASGDLELAELEGRAGKLERQYAHLERAHADLLDRRTTKHPD